MEDVELVVLGGTLMQPAASVAGRPWKAGGRSGVFARPKDGGITLLHGKGAEASVALGDTGRTLTFAMDREQGLHIQDNWKWGREYALRIGTLARRTWRKGETQRYAFTVSADEPIVAKSDLPLVIEPGDDWIPIKYRREIEPGSALDFSGMGFTDAPAGKYGWMRKKYLKEHRPVLYNTLIATGKLQKHLMEIEETAQHRLEQMMAEMRKKAGLTEQMKAENQMEWVGQMNALKAQAEEILINELIYN